MKKLLIVTAVLLGMMAGAMMLSAFTTPKQDAKAECSQSEMGDPWKLMREGVAFCDGDNGTCLGTGDIYVNEDTYQVRITIKSYPGSNSCYNKTYDLTDYTGKDGYNMRFWCGCTSKYCYVMVSRY